MKEFWLLEKHRKNIELTEFDSRKFRIKIDCETEFKFKLKGKNYFNSLFDWEMIKPSFGFFYDYENNLKKIRHQLRLSDLNVHSFIYVETLSNIPIIKTTNHYFIENWFDFVNANAGQGLICITSDFKLLMEFTDDYKQYLFSNFKISDQII